MIPLSQLVGPTHALSVGGTALRRPPFFATKYLGILGMTASLEFAPWADPRWTFAAHPCCRPKCKREPDWYFDMHPRACFTGQKTWNPQYYAWLKALQTPVFMQEDWKDIPMAVRYPKERILAEFRPYFTNHAAWMIALAMTEGVTHIGLFGCQYSDDFEHSVQRDSLTYWLGRFEQAGGTLVIPPRYNTLLAHPTGLYGYESHDDQGKLVAEYRASKPSYKPAADAPAPAVPMAPADPAQPMAETLALPPEGEPIGWERRAALLGV